MKILTVLFVLASSVSLFPQNLFHKMPGPNGGIIIALDELNDGSILAARSSGIFKSTDAGQSWSKVLLNGFGFGGILCISHKNPFSIYAGLSTNGIWWTSTFGSNWNSNPVFVNSGTGTQASVEAIGVDSSGVIYVSTSLTGHWKSFNNGQTFSQFNIPPLSIVQKVNEYTINNLNYICIAATDGIYRSTDNAATWIKLGGGAPETITGGVIYTSQNILFAAAETGAYRSTDNGNTWQQINSGLTNTNLKKIRMNASGMLLAGSVTGKVYTSPDTGNSWSEHSTGINEPVTSLSAAGSTLIAGTQGSGLVRSGDGGQSWSAANNGMSLDYVSSAIEYNTNKIAVSSQSGVYFSADGGMSWEKRINGLDINITKLLNRAPNGDIYVITGGLQTKLYKTTDEGLSWARVLNGINTDEKIVNININSSGIISLAASQPPTQMLYTKIYVSSNSGGSFTQKFFRDTTMLKLFAGTQGSDIYVCGNKLPGVKDSAYHSPDNGETWNRITIVDHNTFLQKRALGVNSNTGNLYAFVGTDNKMYRSTNHGSNWSLQPVPWGTDLTINCITFDSQNRMYLGTYKHGIYTTTNEGTAWENWTSGIYQQDGLYTSINSIFAKADNSVYASANDGLYSNGAVIGIEPGQNLLTNEYSLLQNYPNPFNPSTVITYSLGKTSFVKLRMFDVTGKEIAVVVNEQKPAGNYKIEFNITEYNNLGSGIYFYRLETDDYSQTRKMVLIK
jgi:photosystem II stability/assembly factor-like uncharacterized protein